MPKKYTRLEQAWCMLGEVFGRLMVLDIAGKNAQGHITYDTLCECGTAKLDVSGVYLRNGRIKSCGCLQRDNARRVSALGGAAIKARFEGISVHPRANPA